MQLLSIDQNLVYFIILVFVTFFLQRFFQRILNHFSSKTDNLIFYDIFFILDLVSKVLVGFIVIILIILFFDLSLDIFIFYSAIIGTIISLSSIQIINNLVSGLIIILFIKPYRIYDYLAIGGMEGVVSEISLNYTKIKSIDGTYTLIPNRTVLKTDITNFTIYKDREAVTNKIANLKRYFDDIHASVLTQYTFQLSAPIETMPLHTYAFNKVFDEFEPKFAGYRPKKFIYSLGQKIDYQIIVFAISSRSIRKNLKYFKMRLIEELHSTDLRTDILQKDDSANQDMV